MEWLLRAAYDRLSPAGADGQLTILAFDCVRAACSPLAPGQMHAADFERKATLLRDHFNVLPLTEAVERLRCGRLPARCVCLTFDGAHRENLRTAVPILQRLRLTATFFVASGHLDPGCAWNDHLSRALRHRAGGTLDLRDLGLGRHDVSTAAACTAALRALISQLRELPSDERQRLSAQVAHAAGADPQVDPMMSSQDIRQLAHAGMEIGARTRTGRILAHIDLEQAREEIAGSRRDLESLIGGRVSAFAYPHGRPGYDYRAEHVALVREAGYTSAVTLIPGIAHGASHPLQLPRYAAQGPSRWRFALRLLLRLRTGRRDKGRLHRPDPELLGPDGPSSAEPGLAAAAVGAAAPWTRAQPCGRVPELHQTADVPRVMLIEEGIGYGGAAICAKKLMRQAHRWAQDCMVVSTVPVGFHGASRVVSDLWLVPREVIDLAPLKARLQAHTAGTGRQVLLQVVARLDDLLNSAPRLALFLWLMRRYRPTVVHVNNEPLVNWVPCVAAKLLGIPIVAHVRGEVAYMIGKHRWTLSLPAHIVAVSAWLRDELVGAGVAPERCHLVYDGLRVDDIDRPSQRVAGRQRLGLSDSTLVITLVGMLLAWKGHMLVIDAIERVASDLPDFRLVFVGAPPSRDTGYEEALRARVDRSPLSRNVIFAGLWADATQAYDASDIVLSASLEPEAFGLVVLEAIGRGCAVIAPAWGGAAEIVEPGVSGLLYAPGDAASLGKAIAALASDALLRRRLGEAGRMRARRRFNDDIGLQRMAEIYRSTARPT